MNWIAPWNVVHSCSKCNNGWVCEEHPDKPMDHSDCGAPGMPCNGLLEETAKFEAEARLRLGERCH